MKKLILVETFITTLGRYIVEAEDFDAAKNHLAVASTRTPMEMISSQENFMPSGWILSEYEYVTLFDQAHPDNTLTPEEKEAFIIKIPDSQIEA